MYDESQHFLKGRILDLEEERRKIPPKEEHLNRLCMYTLYTILRLIGTCYFRNRTFEMWTWIRFLMADAHMTRKWNTMLFFYLIERNVSNVLFTKFVVVVFYNIFLIFLFCFRREMVGIFCCRLMFHFSCIFLSFYINFQWHTI